MYNTDRPVGALDWLNLSGPQIEFGVEKERTIGASEQVLICSLDS